MNQELAVPRSVLVQSSVAHAEPASRHPLSHERARPGTTVVGGIAYCNGCGDATVNEGCCIGL